MMHLVRRRRKTYLGDSQFGKYLLVGVLLRRHAGLRLNDVAREVPGHNVVVLVPPFGLKNGVSQRALEI